MVGVSCKQAGRTQQQQQQQVRPHLKNERLILLHATWKASIHGMTSGRPCHGRVDEHQAGRLCRHTSGCSMASRAAHTPPMLWPSSTRRLVLGPTLSMTLRARAPLRSSL